MSESRGMKYFTRPGEVIEGRDSYDPELRAEKGNLEYKIDAICETTERIRHMLFGDEVEVDSTEDKNPRVIDRLLDKSALCVAVLERIEEAVRLL